MDADSERCGDGRLCECAFWFTLVPNKKTASCIFLSGGLQSSEANLSQDPRCDQLPEPQPRNLRRGSCCSRGPGIPISPKDFHKESGLPWVRWYTLLKGPRATVCQELTLCCQDNWCGNLLLVCPWRVGKAQRRGKPLVSGIRCALSCTGVATAKQGRSSSAATKGPSFGTESSNCEMCPLPLIVGTFLSAQRRMGSLFSLILSSCSVFSCILLAGCQMDQVPFCSEWDLEKPRAVKGLDPFTQPPHRQAGLPVGMRAALKEWKWVHAKAAITTHTLTLPRECGVVLYLGVVYSRWASSESQHSASPMTCRHHCAVPSPQQALEWMWLQLWPHWPISQ